MPSHARCIFSRILIGALPLKGQGGAKKVDSGVAPWGNATGQKAAVRSTSFGLRGRQPARFGPTPSHFKREKRLASSFFVSDPRAVLGLLARVQSRLFAPASQKPNAGGGKKMAPPRV
jgi:hypothetical protein